MGPEFRAEQNIGHLGLGKKNLILYQFFFKLQDYFSKWQNCIAMFKIIEDILNCLKDRQYDIGSLAQGIIFSSVSHFPAVILT